MPIPSFVAIRSPFRLRLAGAALLLLAGGVARADRPTHPSAGKADPIPAKPTYAANVAPILRAKCEGCHHPGEVAPFALQTYQQASAWAKDIKLYTQLGQMPPWKAISGYGEFAYEHKRSLSPTELATLAAWADAGAPLGNPKQVPPANKFSTTGWRYGEPDSILVPSGPYRLDAEGEDVYRNYSIPTNYVEDKYVNSVEIKAGNRAVVHHVIVYVDGSGVTAHENGKDGQPGYTSTGGGPGFIPTGFLGGWAPGNDGQLMPDGVAMLIPKGARLVLQVHYHKTGKPETDLTRVGIRFSRERVTKVLHTQYAVNPYFDIPPAAKEYEVKASTVLHEDCHLINMTPHMHLIGKDMKIWAQLPDGTEKPLVWVKNWDFKWQVTYDYKAPVALPKGTVIHAVAHYDNSADNPSNPNRAHLTDVEFGEQTTDEMCVAFFMLTRDAEKLSVATSR